MASSIQLLRSTIARERPFPSSLLEGQPAVNLNQQESGLFFKASDGSLLKIGPVAITADGNPPNANPAGQAGNCVGEMWLDKSTNPAVLKVFDGSSWVAGGQTNAITSITAANSAITVTQVGSSVSIGGITNSVTDIVAGTNVTVSRVGNTVTINSTGGGGGGGLAVLLRWQITALAGQTSLTGNDSNGQPLQYTPGYEEVFVNGVLLTRGTDYTATTGNSISLTTALSSGDAVTVLAWTALTPTNAPVQNLDDISSGFNGTQASFALTSGGSPVTPAFASSVIVSVGGVVQENGTDYTISGSNILFTTPPAAGLSFVGFNFNTVAGGGSPSLPISSNDVTYNQGSTGAVQRTLTSRLRDSVSVKDYGAVGDGVADDTAAIQAAIDAYKPFPQFATGGVEIFFPRGVYRLTASIDLTGCRGLSLSGAGTQVTELRATGNFPVIKSLNTAASPMADATIKDFTIRGGGNSLSNAHGVETLHTNGCTISNLVIYGCKRGLSLTQSWQYHVENVDAHGGGADRCDIGVYLGASNFPADPIDNAVTAYNLTVKDCITAGFRIINAQGSKFVSCEAGACGIGWHIGDPPTGTVQCQWMHVDNCLADSCSGYNWLISKGNASELSQLQFSNCWSGNTGTGTDLIKIVGANDLVFSNWQLIRSPDHCINIENSQRISWSNFQCLDYNRSNAGKHAIRVHNSSNISFFGGMVSNPLYSFANSAFIESGSSSFNTFELPVADGGSVLTSRSSYTRSKGVTVSVLDFGALGTGAQDDGPAIQRAVDFVLAANGGEVIFPAGYYLINSTVNIDKAEYGAGEVRLGIYLRGTSTGTTRIVRSSSLVGPTFYVGGDSVVRGTNAARTYFTISDMEFTSQNPSLPSANFTDAHLSICGLLFGNIRNLTFTDAGCNLLLRGVTQSVISDCTAVWSSNAVSNANRHMVVVDKTPSTYNYQQVSGDLFFDSCNFRMGGVTPNSYPPAKSAMRILCCDGVWIDNSHIQGGDYVIWLDNSQPGVNWGPARALAGVRVNNSYLDLLETGGGLGTATVYISGNAKNQSGLHTFADTVFGGGTTFDYGIYADPGAVDNIYGLQVDDCTFVGYRREAIKMDISAASNFINLQITNNNFANIQAATLTPDSPIISLSNIDNVLIANNMATDTPGANRFVSLNSGVGEAQIVGNMLKLPFVYGGSYSNAIIAASGVKMYQFNNSPVPAQGSYANDIAAAAGGIPVGGFYRDGSNIKQRIS